MFDGINFLDSDTRYVLSGACTDTIALAIDQFDTPVFNRVAFEKFAKPMPIEFHDTYNPIPAALLGF